MTDSFLSREDVYEAQKCVDVCWAGCLAVSAKTSEAPLLPSSILIGQGDSAQSLVTPVPHDYMPGGSRKCFEAEAVVESNAEAVVCLV